MAIDLRVYPPKEFEEVLNKLTEPLSVSQGIQLFESKEKALMFAAGVAWREKNREPLNKKGTGIRFDIFENASDDFFMNILSVADQNSLNILDPDRIKERFEIFQEYAHAGLKKINTECFEKQGDPLMALIKLCVDASTSPGEDEDFDDVWKNLTQ
jgi:dnd system-associated protein 4